jgi:Tfp pilus assembly protein PilX
MMIPFHRKKPKTSERGIALIVALLMLMLISAALMGMVMMSNTETNVSANFRDEQTAFFASKAGVEEVRDRLRTSATDTLTGSGLFSSTNVPPSPLPGQANGILYITNPAAGETDTPWLPLGAVSTYPDDEICKEVTCVSGVPAGTWYASASASTTYAATPKLPWKWVRVMAKLNKPSTTSKLMPVNGSTGGDTTAGYRVCWNGTNEVAVSNITYASCAAANNNYLPVYELTALAVTSSGSRRMTQYEISRTAFPPMPGAMIFDGPSPDFSTNPNSAAFGVSGTDVAQGPNAGAGCGAPASQPGLGGYNAAAAASLGTQVNRPGSYAGSPAGISNVGTQLGPLSTVDGLTNLVNSITTAAGANVYGASPLPSPSTLNLGTNSTPVINVVQGDYSFGGSGAGILLVTGTLTMSGTPNFNGLILVIGKGNVVKNGGGNGTLNGSLFVANMYSDTPPTYTNLIALGANNPPGIPTIAWNGGGNATIQYDSCWISSVTQSFPYRIVAQRELIY